MTTIRNFLILFFLSFFVNNGICATPITSNMQKLGEGEAYYLGFIKVYDASLYSSKFSGTKDILSAEISKCLHLEYQVDIEKNDFIEVANDVIDDQFSKEQLAGVRSDIETLHQGYRNVTGGDSYTLCYNNEDQITTLSFNKEIVASVKSADFAKIYFSIWLAPNNPLDDTLREDLLAALLKN